MHLYYLRINKLIKKAAKVYSVFGGPHPTFFPEIINEEGVDAVCIGESEEAFTEFTRKLSEGKDITKTANFWVKQNGEVFKNEIRPLITDLDTINFPDRELIYKFESSYNNPIKNFIIGRGCPYNCTYCFNHAYYDLYAGKGQRIRLRTPENVIAEISSVADSAPLKIVYFQDDIFVLSRPWLNKFLGFYNETIKLPYHCHLRADLVNEELLELLKISGCLSVTLALESGNDHIRNQVLKRSMSKAQIYSACALLRKFKIRFRTENMIGLPGENIGTALETLKMNIKCGPDIGWASLYQPYPKTVLGAKCKELGLYDGSLDSIRPSFFEESILALKDKRRIENLQKLFSLVVEFPVLLPIAVNLTRLPQNQIFRKIYKTWKEFCYSKRLYLVKPKKASVKRRPKNYFSEFAKKLLRFGLKLTVKTDIFVLLRWFQRKKVIILGYHGISEFSHRRGAQDFDYRHIPLNRFKKQLVYLKKHYNILPLSEIVTRLKKGEALPNNPVAITFDDGYSDVYDNGFALMKRFNVPATVFLISSLIDSPDIPWFDKIELAFNLGKNSQVPICGLPVDLLSREARIKSCVSVKERLKELDSEDRDEAEKKVLEALEFKGPDPDNFYGHLNSQQIKKMSGSLFEFGSHTVTHPILTKVKPDVLDRELNDSKKELSRITDTKVDLFCYPNGSYNHSVVSAVKRAGYSCALTTEYGVNDFKSNLYGLKRIEVGGAFTFEYFVCSLFPGLKKITDKFIKTCQ
jgi:radical SAM superfamily enzyme YgiQ (UPF0313 family)/peptidoglycan/xylan/chitin deacetylase (PgdA/CDA1 family)